MTKNIAINEELFQELKQLCFKRKEVDFNQFIQDILKDYLETYDKYEPPKSYSGNSREYASKGKKEEFGNIFSDLFNNTYKGSK
jgi:metal-responsive CopG/Arc/MetJ family transcriptional regulator